MSIYILKLQNLCSDRLSLGWFDGSHVFFSCISAVLDSFKMCTRILLYYNITSLQNGWIAIRNNDNEFTF